MRKTAEDKSTIKGRVGIVHQWLKHCSVRYCTEDNVIAEWTAFLALCGFKDEMDTGIDANALAVTASEHLALHIYNVLTSSSASNGCPVACENFNKMMMRVTLSWQKDSFSGPFHRAFCATYEMRSRCNGGDWA